MKITCSDMEKIELADTELKSVSGGGGGSYDPNGTCYMTQDEKTRAGATCPFVVESRYSWACCAGCPLARPEK